MDFPRNVGMIVASEAMTMTRRPRRNHSSAFKAKVSVVAITGEKILIELAQSFDIQVNQVT
jgi:transposase